MLDKLTLSPKRSKVRSPDLNMFIEDKFVDIDAYKKRHENAEDLKSTTHAVKYGFIDKNKLSTDPNSIFSVIGFEQCLRNFKFSG